MQNVFGTVSIIYDGRSVMSVVTFRTASPIGGLSCFRLLYSGILWKHRRMDSESAIFSIAVDIILNQLFMWRVDDGRPTLTSFSESTSKMCNDT